MRSRSGNTRNEALAYLAGFVLIAVAGTFLLLSQGQQVANWKLLGVFITEFGCGELMRSAYVLLLKKRAQHEFS